MQEPPQNIVTQKAFKSAFFNDQWTVKDDYLLIKNLEKTQDISIIQKCVNFSKNFTAKEIKNRWHAILYDPVSQNLLKNRIEKIDFKKVVNPDEILPSMAELVVISRIKSNILEHSTPDKFLKIFKNDRNFNIWSKMRWHSLLCDQKIERGDENVSIFDQVESSLIKNIPPLGHRALGVSNANAIFDGSSSSNCSDISETESEINDDLTSTNIYQPNNETFQEKLTNAKNLANKQNYDLLYSSSNKIKLKNLSKMEKYHKKIKKYEFKNENTYGFLQGRFIKYYLEERIEMFGLYDIFNARTLKNNLNLEYNNCNLPDEIFKIRFLESEKNENTENVVNCVNHAYRKIILTNTTKYLDDIPIFITSQDQSTCLLNNESIELNNLDYILVFDLKFIFYANIKYSPENMNEKSVSNIPTPGVIPDLVGNIPISGVIQVIPNNHNMGDLNIDVTSTEIDNRSAPDKCTGDASKSLNIFDTKPSSNGILEIYENSDISSISGMNTLPNSPSIT